MHGSLKLTQVIMLQVHSIMRHVGETTGQDLEVSMYGYLQLFGSDETFDDQDKQGDVLQPECCPSPRQVSI